MPVITSEIIQERLSSLSTAQFCVFRQPVQVPGPEEFWDMESESDTTIRPAETIALESPLPPELWLSIFLGPGRDRETLKAVTLTCHYFRALVQPQLFHRFIVFPKLPSKRSHVRSNSGGSDSSGKLTRTRSLLATLRNPRDEGDIYRESDEWEQETSSRLAFFKRRTIAEMIRECWIINPVLSSQNQHEEFQPHPVVSPVQSHTATQSSAWSTARTIAFIPSLHRKEFIRDHIDELFDQLPSAFYNLTGIVFENVVFSRRRIKRLIEIGSGVGNFLRDVEVRSCSTDVRVDEFVAFEAVCHEHGWVTIQRTPPPSHFRVEGRTAEKKRNLTVTTSADSPLKVVDSAAFVHLMSLFMYLDPLSNLHGLFSGFTASSGDMIIRALARCSSMRLSGLTKLELPLVAMSSPLLVPALSGCTALVALSIMNPTNGKKVDRRARPPPLAREIQSMGVPEGFLPSLEKYRGPNDYVVPLLSSRDRDGKPNRPATLRVLDLTVPCAADDFEDTIVFLSASFSTQSYAYTTPEPPLEMLSIRLFSISPELIKRIHLVFPRLVNLAIKGPILQPEEWAAILTASRDSNPTSATASKARTEKATPTPYPTLEASIRTFRRNSIASLAALGKSSSSRPALSLPTPPTPLQSLRFAAFARSPASNFFLPPDQQVNPTLDLFVRVFPKLVERHPGINKVTILYNSDGASMVWIKSRASNGLGLGADQRVDPMDIRVDVDVSESGRGGYGLEGRPLVLEEVKRVLRKQEAFRSLMKEKGREEVIPSTPLSPTPPPKTKSGLSVSTAFITLGSSPVSPYSPATTMKSPTSTVKSPGPGLFEKLKPIKLRRRLTLSGLD